MRRRGGKIIYGEGRIRLDKNNTKNLVICECKRIVEILESETQLISWHSPIVSELKAKMHELRRDTKRLENQIYRPEEYKTKARL